LRTRQTETRSISRRNMEKASLTQKRYFDKGRRAVEYRPGQLVMIYKPTSGVGKSAKLMTTWRPRHRIVEKKGDLNYVVEDLQANTEAKRFSTVHTEQILPWKEREKNTQINITNTNKKKRKERPIPKWYWIDKEDEDDEDPESSTRHENVSTEEGQQYGEQSSDEEGVTNENEDDEEYQFEEATDQQELETATNEGITEAPIQTPDRTKTASDTSKNKGFLSLLTDSWTQFKNTSPADEPKNPKVFPIMENEQLNSTPMSISPVAGSPNDSNQSVEEQTSRESSKTDDLLDADYQPNYKVAEPAMSGRVTRARAKSLNKNV
jgi:hypothetical protein